MIDGAAANQALAALADSVAGGESSPAEALSTGPLQAWLVLRSGSRWLALPTDSVREVVLKTFITRVPHSPPHVLGVMLIRGRLLPVVALDPLLRSEAATAAVVTLPRLVVIESDDAECAIVADEVHGIVEFAADSLKDQATRGTRPAWVSAEISWEKKLLCILHPDRLLSATLGPQGGA